MKFTIIIFIALSIYFVPIQAQRVCGKNEVYLECYPCKALSCGETPPDACVAACISPGCFCKDGFLRKNGDCVPKNQC